MAVNGELLTENIDGIDNPTEVRPTVGVAQERFVPLEVSTCPEVPTAVNPVPPWVTGTVPVIWENGKLGISVATRERKVGVPALPLGAANIVLAV